MKEEKDEVQQAIDLAKAAADKKKAQQGWRRRVNKRRTHEHWTETEKE